MRAATEEERRRKAAERQARYRERLKVRAEAHDAGDHSTCRPDQCEEARADGADEPVGDAAGDVTRDVTATPKNSASHREPPADLRDRGRRLWAEMAGLKLGPTHVLLLERACRLADRLARLDELLEGGDWLDTVVGEVSDLGAVEVRVTVDRALGETRQHDVALKLLVAELRHAGRSSAAGPAAPAAEGSGSEGGGEGGGKRRGLAAIRGGLDTTG